MQEVKQEVSSQNLIKKHKVNMFLSIGGSVVFGVTALNSMLELAPGIEITALTSGMYVALALAGYNKVKMDKEIVKNESIETQNDNPEIILNRDKVNVAIKAIKETFTKEIKGVTSGFKLQ